MKIITPPTTDYATQSSNCTNCKARLKLSPSDFSPAPKFGVYAYICPCCKQKQFVDAKNLNAGVKNALKVHKHHWN